MRYYYYWLALVVFAIDFITKKLIETRLEIGDKISVIDNFFLITSHRNAGAAFGILQNQTIFFIIVSSVVIVGLLVYTYMHRNSGKPMLLCALGLVLGGAFGNFLDRVLYGEVVDFLQFNFGTYTFPIFNVADMGIVIGVGLIMLDTVLSMKDEQNALKSNLESGDRNERNEQPNP